MEIQPNAVINARVSRDEQAKNYSLPTQIDACRRYAAERGYLVVAEYKEDHTGAEFDRPALDRMRRDIRAGNIQKVVVYSIDRWARKLLYSLLLEEEMKKAGVDVEYVQAQYDNTPEGQLMKQLAAGIAEYERSMIAARMMRGKYGRVSAGFVVASRNIPYGYRYQAGVRQGWYDIEEPEAEVIRQVFAWCVEGAAIIEIANRLSARRIPTREDLTKRVAKTRLYGVWGPSTVNAILHNPIYKGHYTWGRSDKRQSVEVPAIVSAETWNAAQEQMKRNTHLSLRNTKRDYLMRGRLRCAVCGYVFHIKSPNRITESAYYGCFGQVKRNSPDGQSTTCHGFLRQDRVDEYCWQEVASWLNRPDLLDGIRDDFQAAAQADLTAMDQEASSLRARLNDLSRRQDRLIDMYQMDTIDKAALERSARELAEKRSEYNTKLDALDDRMAHLKSQSGEFNRLKELLSQLGKPDDFTSFQDRQRVVERLGVFGIVTRGEGEDRIILYPGGER